VVAVNQRLAQQLASGGSAIGQTLTFDFGNGPQTATIVGIVADIHHEALNVPAAPEAYFTFEQWDPIVVGGTGVAPCPRQRGSGCVTGPRRGTRRPGRGAAAMIRVPLEGSSLPNDVVDPAAR
jgi:hypothetical protein